MIYTSAVGDAGQRYLDELCRNPRTGDFQFGPVWLPGTFRWEELFDRMNAAAAEAGGVEAEDRLPVHGCPVCDDAMGCSCEPRLPFGGDA